MSRYFFADSNLIDHVLYEAHIPVEDRSGMRSFLGGQGLLDRGAKFTCPSLSRFNSSREVFNDLGARTFAGGSAANVAVTLKLLLGEAAEVDFFTSIDSTIYSGMLRGTFQGPGINLIEAEETAAHQRGFRQGESLIFVPKEDPDRSIMKSPASSAHTVLAGARLPSISQKATTVFFQLSAEDKFGRPFAERMLKANSKASLAVGLSTKKELSREERMLAQELVLRRRTYIGGKRITCPRIIAANAKELSTAFDGMPVESALRKIHAEWKRR